MPLTSQPSPVALNEDDADKDDDEAVHPKRDLGGYVVPASTARGEVGAVCTAVFLTGAVGPVR